MKPTFKKTVRVVLVSFVLLLSSCENDSSSSGTQIPQDTNIQSAKKWFDAYEDKGENIVLMQNLDYNWNDAQLTKSEDGTETIIVPVNELKKDQGDLWEQKLYIYKLDEDRYTALLFEAYSNKNIKPESQSVDGGDFTGYITVWDLKKGFVRGAKFLNNQVVEEGVAEFSIDRNKTNRAPETGECIFSDLDDGCHNDGGDGAAIPLREVIVKGPSTGTPVIYTPRGPVIGGTTPGGYTSPGGGGGNSGGGGITAPTNAEIAAAIQKKINDDKLDACTKAILEKLKKLQQADLATIMSKLGNNSEIYTLTFDIGDAKGNPAGTTRNSLNSYIVLLDKDFLDGNDGTGINKPPTDLAIASVIIHEVVHAYFFSLFDDKVNSGMPKALDNFDLLYQRYVTKNYTGADDAQHAQIWKSFIDIMSSSLQEYSTGVPTNSPSQFYKDIILGTLIKTNTFSKNYPIDSAEYKRILNNYLTEKNNGSNDPSYKPKGKSCK